WQRDGRVMGPGEKSTRGWDDERGVTVLQREKEDAHDYRYFPDPDLVPVSVSPEWLERVRAQVPELPLAAKKRYREKYGLDEKEATALVDDRRLCEHFESCVEAAIEAQGSAVPAAAPGLLTAKFLLNAGAKRANERGVPIQDLGVAPRRVGQIIRLRDEGRISAQAADTLYGMVSDADAD